MNGMSIISSACVMIYHLIPVFNLEIDKAQKCDQFFLLPPPKSDEFKTSIFGEKNSKSAISVIRNCMEIRIRNYCEIICEDVNGQVLTIKRRL